MSRTLRIGLSVIILLLVLFFGVLIFFYYFFDINQLKPILVEEISRRTGYQLTISGPLRLSLYPRLGIKIEQMTLSLPKKDKVFLSLSGVKFSSSKMLQIHLKNQEMQGTLQIDEISIFRVKLKNLKTNFDWKAKQLTFSNIVGDLYEGNVLAFFQANNVDTMPALTWTSSFKNVQIKPLLNDLMINKEAISLSGKGDIQFNGKSIGKLKADLINNFDGTAQFAVLQGQLEGLDLNFLLRSAVALIKRQSVNLSSQKNTPFEAFKGDAIIQKGIIRSENLTLLSTDFSADAKGLINLSDEKMTLKIALKGRNELQTKWEIPVIVSGDLSDPNIHLDMNEIQKMIVNQQLQEIKTKVEKKVEEKIQGPAENILKQLFGGS